MIFLVVFVVGLYLLSKKRREKLEEDLPNSALVIVLAILLSLLLAQFSQQRPYNVLALVFFVITSIVVIVFFAFLLWPFRKLGIFVHTQEKKYVISRFLVVAYLYFTYFVIIRRGFSFFLNGIINPEAIALTPEFDRYVIPTLSGLILLIYRLTTIFSSKSTEFFGEMSKDVIIFSFLMFWLNSVSAFIGVNISTDLPLPTFEETALLGGIVAVGSVGLEGVIVWIQRDLSKTGRSLSVERVILSMFGQFISKRKRISQRTLDEFYPKPIAKRSLKSANRAIKVLDKRFSLRYRGRVIRASTLLTSALLLSTILLAAGLMISKDIIVLAPAFSVEINLVTKAELSDDAMVVVSENAEFILTDKVYAIPVVSVKSSNLSFLAPLSSRFLALNSSDFMVSKADQYLTILLTMEFVETVVRTRVFMPTKYNQTSNENFGYRGFFREAEIFYCLAKFGFNEITTLSTTSLQGFIHVVQKSIFAKNSTGCAVLVYVEQRGETIIYEDRTHLICSNEDIINEAIFLIEQTKTKTECVKQIKSPTVPYRFFDN